MKSRRFRALGVLVAVGALALAGCDAPEGSSVDEGSVVRVGWHETFSSQNFLTSVGATSANANVLYLTNAAFNYYDADLTVARNTDFGDYEVLSEDPLTVQYTIQEGATWSDGAPVDAADVVLWWGAQNDSFDDVEPEYDEEWNVTNTDEIEAGVYFDSSSPAMNLISQAPEVSEDGRTVTFTYEEPRSDWEIAIQPSPVAAHALASLALGVDDVGEGKQRVIDAFANGVTEDLSALARSWNNDFNFASLPDDERLYLSSSAYVMTEYVENQYLTVTAREDYDWGPAPTVETITFRFLADPLAAVGALQNGELDLIQPQASVDVIRTLEEIEGIEFATHAEATYEHVDLVVDNGGPFDPASYGGDEDVARAVRQAFLLSVPRQEIIDRLIAPLQPDAEPRNSHTVVPGAPAYDEVVADNGSDFYAETDVERATALLDAAGVEGPIDVRFLYGASNTRRADQYALIAASAAEAGFNVLNEGDDNWGNRIVDTATYDASLWAFQSTNTYALNSESLFVTDGLNSFSGYSSPEIDSWYRELGTTTDPDRETQLATDIDRVVLAEALALPIFQFPAVVAWRADLEGVSFIPVSPTIFWNYWDWQIAGSQADAAAESDEPDADDAAPEDPATEPEAEVGEG